MKIMHFLLEYTLEIVLEGNKSECARRLGIDYHELRRISKRLENGAGSVRITEAVLRFYLCEHISIDKALDAYITKHPELGIGNTDRFCDDLLDEIHSSLNIAASTTQEQMLLLNTAQAFINQVEQVFCEQVCNRKHLSQAECPCKRFSTYMSWIQEELAK